MKSPEWESSPTFGAPGTGLGVAGVDLASPSSSSSPSSPSITRTPRWGSIRQRFSSIHSRDTPPVPVDSVDDAMWDKNDAAFLEEVALSSPLPLSSPDRFDSLAPVFEDVYTRRASTTSARISSLVRSNHDEHPAQLHRHSYQPRPSSASGSTPSSAASAASTFSTPFVTHDDASASGSALMSTKPWPRPMHRMSSASLLPGLPERDRKGDSGTIACPATASSATPMSPSLLPAFGSSPSFMSNANGHTLQSPGGKSSTRSSVRSSPSLPYSIHASTSDGPRSATTADPYPRSPSLQSSSSLTTSIYNFRSFDDRSADWDSRVRTSSCVSTFGAALAPSITGIDRHTSRSVIGSPLALGASFFPSRPSSPDAFLYDNAVVLSPSLPNIAAENSLADPATDSARRPSISSVLGSPKFDAARAHGYHSSQSYASEHLPRAAESSTSTSTSQITTSPRGKRVASSSMRGVPGSPTKRSNIIAASTLATDPSATASSDAASNAPSSIVRKHTKNKSSLVSGLRKLMGKRQRDNKAVPTVSDPSSPVKIASGQPTTSPLIEQSMIDLPADTETQSASVHRDHSRFRAMSIDASVRSGFNPSNLAPDVFASDSIAKVSPDQTSSRASIKGSQAFASSSISSQSPPLDLVRSFATMGREAQAVPLDTAQEPQMPSTASRSRTKSIDSLTRPLRDVLAHRSRNDASNHAATRTSVIEHISHNEARRLTGSTGPVILRTQEALEGHRSCYASPLSEFGLSDRFDSDVPYPTLLASRQPNMAAATSAHTERNPASSAGAPVMQSPVRPLRPDETSSHASASHELLTPSNSGEAVSGTGSSNLGGISSSGSSFVSASSAATDPAVGLRAPFSFQSQAYRPYSRESRSSHKVQPSPPSTPSSHAAHLPSEHDGSHGVNRPAHCVPTPLGPQSAVGSAHSGQASEVMLPPAPTKRGHTSRRSLNSLVSSKPWSNFLGSPVLGSSKSLSHHKRISTASISRPLSVSSSAFSSDMHDLSTDLADLTLRASDFPGACTRMRVDSTHSNFSEPGFQGWKPVSAVAAPHHGSHRSSSSVHGQPPSHSHSHTHTHAHSHSVNYNFANVAPPSGPHPVALAPPAGAASSNSSHHSHHSHRSHHSNLSYPHSGASTSSAFASSSTLAPAVATASHRLIPTASSSASRQQAHVSHSATSHHLSSTSSPALLDSARFQVSGTSGPGIASPLDRPTPIQAIGDVGAPEPLAAHALLFSSSTRSPSAAVSGLPTTRSFSSRPRPPGAGHRSSASGSALSHGKRPSFGLAIEPAAHSAFDSIPSPLLRTRRTSLTLPEGSTPERSFFGPPASAARPSGASPVLTPNSPVRDSAAAPFLDLAIEGEDSVEIETLRDGSPPRTGYTYTDQLTAAPAPIFKNSMPALEGAMAAAMLQPTSMHRHSVSVPVDEGDSPRQHQEESWNRATGGTVLTYSCPEQLPQSGYPQHSAGDPAPRQYMIHSPNEEEGPALVTPATASASSARLSQASKDIAFGSIAGMVSKVFEHPFDLVKVRLQTQSADGPPRYAGAFDCFKQTYLQEGIRGLYRGLSMPIFGATLENACLFFTYNQIQSAIRWANGEARSASAAQADAESPLSIPQLGIAAAGAGAVTSLVLTPIELIKCKMQVQMITREQHVPAATAKPGVTAAAASASHGGGAQLQQQRSLYTSAVRSASAGANSSAQAFKSLDGPLTLLRRTIAADGIRGLWLGQTGTLLRETGGGIAWFLAFESCSRYLLARKKVQWNRQDVTKKDLSSLELVGAGALAGISYNVVLFPADCVKSTMQTEQEMRSVSSSSSSGLAGEKWKRTGFYDTFKNIYRTRGIRGLYAGCGVTCLRSAPSSAIIFLMYNKLEKLTNDYGL